MNLDIALDTSKTRVRRMVLHEFGHALGCSHEHSSPAAKIKWKENAVYDHYREMNRWDERTVDHNVLRVIQTTQYSPFDDKSIMIYRIPAKLTLDNFSVPEKPTELSSTDKSFIAMMYPPNDVWCNRCKGRIDTSNPNEGHKYCMIHSDYLCAGCYSNHRRRLVGKKRCWYHPNTPVR
ncbi:hypothetical protein B0T25DRAFT_554935 [Lasiosphaeria hispida]|uniref:Peptidase M12A domain-containing protein n=1 Tax=Lasiosphaeria hispida TaxID=260671 RepID=A0AAJ0H8C9_9PEZI|nr:hypothetical protein B0T25DRAFT_554935 [Lasiosphaeria hispida]